MPILRAAVSGATERLRPILLTTLTTVLGLAPLMYEQSRQSLFLKPTVVTLVYGLTVGFFIVLLLVPALLLVQNDLSQRLTSLRHLIRGHRMPERLRRAAGGMALAIVAVTLVLMLPWALTGTALIPLPGLPPLLSSLTLTLLADLTLAWGFLWFSRQRGDDPRALSR